ncbi:MAG: class I SAM-dependent rRNA methyltransferase [Candidatus Latescibacterota bacterium]|nr:MAG: class I SAM-dependent rRNA methyltransferase [Candidatus Latescibacterota bacterium]
MLTLPVVRLKKGRERPARAGHPWLFSGAFDALPQVEPGSLCRIEDASGRFIAVGYANPERNLAVRVLAWEEVEDVTDLVRSRIQAAVALRRSCVPADTDAYRVVCSEGDFLPGLVVDRYADVVILQVLTAGMERLLDRIVEIVIEELAPRTLFERSDVPARREERLPLRRRLVWGEELPESVEVYENGLRYLVQPDVGQKTGFYLDQRDNRRRVRSRARDRRVLNCFAYTGAFSVAALAGGASRVTSVESSAPSFELLRRNLALNEYPEGEIVHGDVFDVLRSKRSAGERYDLVILDPPAFAKKRHQRESARRGYKEINLQALQLLAPGGELFTFSCSQYVDAVQFKMAVFEAAANAGTRAQLLAALGPGCDHPVSVSHLEGEYLKGLHLRRVELGASTR